MKEKKYYETFFDFWKDNYPHLDMEAKQAALEAWDAAIDGSYVMEIEDYSDGTILVEAIKRIRDIIRGE